MQVTDIGFCWPGDALFLAGRIICSSAGASPMLLVQACSKGGITSEGLSWGCCQCCRGLLRCSMSSTPPATPAQLRQPLAGPRLEMRGASTALTVWIPLMGLGLALRVEAPKPKQNPSCGTALTGHVPAWLLAPREQRDPQARAGSLAPLPPAIWAGTNAPSSAVSFPADSHLLQQLQQWGSFGGAQG